MDIWVQFKLSQKNRCLFPAGNQRPLQIVVFVYISGDTRIGLIRLMFTDFFRGKE